MCTFPTTTTTTTNHAKRNRSQVSPESSSSSALSVIGTRDRHLASYLNGPLLGSATVSLLSSEGVALDPSSDSFGFQTHASAARFCSARDHRWITRG
ncbi:unnamed protein product [Lota lota]